MNKKRIIILIISIFVLLSIWGAYGIYENYKLGQELYASTGDLSLYTATLSDGIDHLLESFDKPGSDISRDRRALDIAIISVEAAGFGSADMPILDEVRLDYVSRFHQIYLEILYDYDNAAVTKLFDSPSASSNMTLLRDSLDNMTNCFQDFQERYNQMSFLEKCFTFWSNERDILSEAVKLPQ